MNRISGLLPLLVLAGCSPSEQPASESSSAGDAPVAELRSGILFDNMNASVRPGDDFNAYVNGTWENSTEIPADKTSYGVSRILRDEAQANVRKIIEESAAGNNSQGSDEQKVGDLYQSYLNTELRNELGFAPLAGELERIAAIESYDDLAAYFAYANKYAYGTPFGLILYPDLKKPTHYAIYTWQGGLGLPDREYYTSDQGNFAEIRQQYTDHIAKMLDLAGMGNGAESAKTIMALETRIAEQHMLKEDTRDFVALYNMYPTASLDEVMTEFNWSTFLESADMPELDQLVVTQPDYMAALDKIITDTDLDTWKTFLRWGLLNANASILNEELDQQNFEFYNKTLGGQQEQLPMWHRGVSLVNGNLGEVVGKVYVKEHFPPQAKEEMLVLVNNLIVAYEQSINELDWMGEETRVEALDKLSKFTPKIGYPDIWKDYSALEIDSTDLLGNMRGSAEVVYQQNVDKLAGPVQKHEWGMTPQTVNAYYNAPLNEIVFPAAILQPPYFDLDAENAVNYGAIGAVIGHEIGHGFDDAGSTFDGDGVLRDWWTEEDKAEFEKRTQALIAQYDAFAVFDDLNVNGTFTLGENIGDLGGLSIALKAYKMSLGGEPAPVLDGLTGEQRVFIGYAQAWLRKSREEALRRQVNTDPHSPAMFRVNGVVRNVPEFYTAFDVKEDDDLYLPPEERVKIW